MNEMLTNGVIELSKLKKKKEKKGSRGQLY